MFEMRLGMDVAKKRQQSVYGYFIYDEICEILNTNDQLNNILANKLQTDFDAIIIEPGIVSHCLSYIGANSTLPVIHTSPIPINAYTKRITYGDVHNPATASTILFQYAVPRMFIQRLTNTLVFCIPVQ